MTANASNEPDYPSIRIHEEAGPEEVAAVVAAVVDVSGGDARPGTPPWLQAALREGVGERPAAEPSDLRSPA